ncbi:hypothetical protein OAV13_00870 [bacterium]|nr:hypothetical protein [bacterium]
MEYYKFHIDEDNAESVYCEYRDLSKGKSSPLITRSYPIDIMGERESKIFEMVEGDITDVYYEEFNGEVKASEVKWFLGDIEKNSEEDIDWIKTFVKCACLNEDYDYLIAPASVDQQVAEFIKEFFDEEDEFDNEKPLKQADFLAEFFAELDSK